MLIKDFIEQLQKLPPSKHIYLEDMEYGLSEPYIYYNTSKAREEKDNYYCICYDPCAAKDY